VSQVSRSAGVETAGLLDRKAEERDLPDSPEALDGGREKGDARILESGDFVSKIVTDANDSVYLIDEILKPKCRHYWGWNLLVLTK